MCSPGLHGGGAESTLGQRHDRVRDRGGCQAVSRRDSGSPLPVRRGVGDQRRERSTVDVEGPRDGDPAALPDPGLLHHSDRGCTYTSGEYQTYLAARHITCSMSRRGDCYDNAVTESFFATVKKEEADRFPSYSDAKMALFITSKCSITSSGAIRHSARSVRPRSSGAQRRRAWRAWFSGASASASAVYSKSSCRTGTITATECKESRQ
jgi:hypothetical protein